MIAVGLLITLVVTTVLYLLVFKQPSAHAADYPIHGFDVSHHQKEIDWKKIPKQKYKFVYLKSTEGGDFKDTKFQEYWLQAREQGFLVGAYHFYRLCRDGSIQAQNFIESVRVKRMPCLLSWIWNMTANASITIPKSSCSRKFGSCMMP